MSTLLLSFLLGCNGKDADTSESTKYQFIDTETNPNVAEDFESAESCGECHPVHFEQWQQSMHSYATRSPIFEHMAAKAYRDSAGEVGGFCTRCHSVAGDLIGEDGSFGYEDRSDIGKEGVTCVTCHQVKAHSWPLGNANFELDPFGAVYGPFQDADQQEHASIQGELIQSAELCGSCHDVFMFPGIAVEQAYSEYITSPAAEEGTTCQDCHMTPNPGVVTPKERGPIAVVAGQSYPDRDISEHYFTGPDYAVVDDWPYDSITENQANFEAGLERTNILLQNSIEIDSMQSSIRQGALNIEIVLESLVDGHNVPTGFTSERQLWLEVTVRDRDQEIVFQSGDLDSYSDLRDQHSWDVLTGEALEDTQLCNLQSTNQVIRRHYLDNGENDPQGFTEYDDAVFPFQATTIIRNSLKPREVRPIQYSIEVANPPQNPYSIDARLRYRNMPPYVLRGMQMADMTSKLQIFDIDQKSATAQ